MDNSNLPSCCRFVVAAVNMAGVARKRVTSDVLVALSAGVVIRTCICVVVARMVGCDERAVDIATRVDRE